MSNESKKKNAVKSTKKHHKRPKLNSSNILQYSQEDLRKVLNASFLDSYVISGEEAQEGDELVWERMKREMPAAYLQHMRAFESAEAINAHDPEKMARIRDMENWHLRKRKTLADVISEKLGKKTDTEPLEKE